MEQRGIRLGHLIEIRELGFYGFDNDIINDMVKYEIFPQVYKVKNKLYVQRSVIFGIVETFLKNAMTLYKAVEETEKVKAELAERAVPVDVLTEVMDEAKELGIEDVEQVQELLDAKLANTTEPEATN
jgi:Na+-transporting NADH:ubiquinone oxidoreductase subunit NqrA